MGAAAGLHESSGYHACTGLCQCSESCHLLAEIAAISSWHADFGSLYRFS